jgi:hypothetical protein
MKNGIIVLVILFFSISAQAIPTLKLISPYATPDSGWVVRGAISFSLSATSTLPITKVEFYIDNVLKSTDTTYPYSYFWNTRSFTTGNHTLKAIAYDSQSSATISQLVTVNPALVLKTTTKSAVTGKLLPTMTELISNIEMRDASICIGPDNVYYLVGAMSDNSIWYHNEGVNLWKSVDLKNWTYVGLVWSFENDASTTDKTWNLFYDQQFRAVWNTKIQYLEGNYYLSFRNPIMGTQLLKSSTAKPEGPYLNQTLEDNLTQTTLFNDSLNKYKLYFEMMNTGFLFKTNGKYYLSTANFMDTTNRYSSYVGVSDSLTGTFTNWHEALPCGGNATYFTDTQGNIWATLFGNDDSAPWREKPGIVKMAVDVSTGKLKVSTDQTLPPVSPGTGINDLNALPDIKIFPNPATNFLFIENAENTTVSFFNISGELMLKLKCSDHLTKINVSGFSNGFYLVSVEKNEMSAIRKISINN